MIRSTATLTMPQKVPHAVIDAVIRKRETDGLAPSSSVQYQAWAVLGFLDTSIMSIKTGSREKDCRSHFGQITAYSFELDLISNRNRSRFLTGSHGHSSRRPSVRRQLFSPLSRTATPVTACIGRQPVDVLYAGLAPGFVGLGQFNLGVPAVSTRLQPMIITINGIASNAPVITVLSNDPAAPSRSKRRKPR